MTESKLSAHSRSFEGRQVLAISGGVGGAKLALGLSKLLPPEQLAIVTNTADDFEHLGLSISPDLDTVMYTLAGLNDQDKGWGLADEGWKAMEALKTLGGDDWFLLGDKDLATHLVRTQRLKQGQSLTEVTNNLCKQLGIEHSILPMSNDSVRTFVNTKDGPLAFQHYFVKEQCAPAVNGFYFEGIDTAQANPELLHILKKDDLGAIVICPSNPFVSVSPLLELRGIRNAIAENPAPVIAVSPIVAGNAIKGPTAKMMSELNMPASAKAVAEFYGDLLDGYIIDESDADQTSEIEAMGLPVLVAPTIMRTLQDRIELATDVLNFAGKLSGTPDGGA